MLGVYWHGQPWWWCVPVIVAVAILILSFYWPLALKREVTRREKIRRVLLCLSFFIVWNILLVLWSDMLDARRDSRALEMSRPPATQFAHRVSE